MGEHVAETNDDEGRLREGWTARVPGPLASERSDGLADNQELSLDRRTLWRQNPGMPRGRRREQGLDGVAGVDDVRKVCGVRYAA